MEELKVKAGDKLLCKRYGYLSSDESITEVERVTPSGRIKVVGMDCHFNKYGNRIGGDRFRESIQLSIPSTEDLERIKKTDTIKKAKDLIILNKDKLSYMQAVKIIELFGENSDI